MLQTKDLAKKIGINLIYFIGISLLALLVSLVYGHPHVPALPFTIFFIIIFGFDIFICNFFTGLVLIYLSVIFLQEQNMKMPNILILNINGSTTPYHL